MIRLPVMSRYWICALGGVLFSLGFPSVLLDGNGVLPILGFVLLFHCWARDADRLYRGLLFVLCFSIGFSIPTYYWMADTLEVFGGLPRILALGVCALFSLIALPQHTVGVLVLTGLRTKTIARTMPLELTLLFIAMLLTLLEYYVPQQYATHIGHGWLAHRSWLALAPILGACFYSFLSYWIALTVVSLLHKKKHLFSWAMIGILLLACRYVPLPDGHDPEDCLNVRVCQANIGNFLKVNARNGHSHSREEVVAAYQMLALAPYDTAEHPDLIILPETAYPFRLDSRSLHNHPDDIPVALQEIMNATKACLLTGGYDIDPTSEEDNGTYNAVFVFAPDRAFKGSYHKHLLMPFGESLPFGPLNQRIASHIPNMALFSRGTTFDVFQIDHFRFITPICYEMLSTSFIRNYLNASEARTDYIINVVNDSWFGKTSEPAQHKFLAHWRSLEFQMPVIRATNTGITSILYPDGSESQRLGIGVQGVLDVGVASHCRQRTVYQRYGIAALAGAWLVMLCLYASTHYPNIRTPAISRS